jgi:glycerol uptake facilitator-like aquaporin
VTIARSVSDTFAGIAPAGIVGFIVAQLLGMLAAVALAGWLWAKAKSKSQVVEKKTVRVRATN